MSYWPYFTLTTRWRHFDSGHASCRRRQWPGQRSFGGVTGGDQCDNESAICGHSLQLNTDGAVINTKERRDSNVVWKACASRRNEISGPSRCDS